MPGYRSVLSFFSLSPHRPMVRVNVFHSICVCLSGGGKGYIRGVVGTRATMGKKGKQRGNQKIKTQDDESDWLRFALPVRRGGEGPAQFKRDAAPDWRSAGQGHLSLGEASHVANSPDEQPRHLYDDFPP